MQINQRDELPLNSPASKPAGVPASRLTYKPAGGFTLMELLVAVVLAGLLTGTALAFWQGTHFAHHHLVQSYLEGTSALLDEIRAVYPYDSCGRRRNLPKQ